MTTTRRSFLATSLAGLAACAEPNKSSPPVDAPLRIITKGPKHHWFSYYDKLQFDPTNRYVLCMEVDFEHRTPTIKDTIRIGMVDLEDNDRWIDLDQSNAWGWQQGCMLQWLPGSESEVIFNDREGSVYVSRILDVKSGNKRTIPHPIYSVSPDGKSAVTPDFRRIQDVRPGYGYVGAPDPHSGDLAPEESGIFHINLETGESKLIVSLAQISETGEIPSSKAGIKHYFNQLLFSPDGSRFIALHRWRYPKGNRLTRMITANPDGSDVRIVDGNGYHSHFIWRDPTHILGWSNQPSHGRAFYLFEDGTDKVEAIGPDMMQQDGHCTYLPGHNNEWILNDTYPDDQRLQHPYLYHVPSVRKIELAAIHSPEKYTGEWRCDTHPRHSRDGKLVCFDSPHQGEGRQLHLVDVSQIVSGLDHLIPERTIRVTPIQVVAPNLRG